MPSVASEPRSAHASVSLKAACADPVLIPPDPRDEEQWRLWGQDRAALAQCKAMNAAKAAALDALEGQGTR